MKLLVYLLYFLKTTNVEVVSLMCVSKVLHTVAAASRLPATDIHRLGDVEIASEKPRESLLELLVCQRVAKRIDRTVGVA